MSAREAEKLKKLVVKQKGQDKRLWEARLVGEGESIGELLCELTDYSGGWRISSTQPDNEYDDYVSDLRFPTANHGANFLWLLRRRSDDVVRGMPLAADVRSYMCDRAEHLRKEERRALDQFLQIRCERYALKKMADQYGLGKVKWRTEDTDPEQALRQLLEFKVTLELPKDGADPDDENAETETTELPLFSETALHELLGKDDARTVCILLKKVALLISPRITEELL